MLHLAAPAGWPHRQWRAGRLQRQQKLSIWVSRKGSKQTRRRSMGRTSRTGIHPAARSARQQLLQGRIDRREFLTRSLVTGLGLAGVGARGEDRHRLGLRRRPPADADLLPVDPGPASRHPGGQRQVPRHQLPDRAGRGLRHRALRRRSQEQAEHLGRLCRPDAVRRNVGADQGRRHRALGQLHPEGGHRRHHPVDPRRMHGRRQAL